MQGLLDAITPDALAVARKMYGWREPARGATLLDCALMMGPEGYDAAAALDRRLRAQADARAEADDRNRHERRKADALARRERIEVTFSALREPV